jgi:hypothetical protein
MPCTIPVTKFPRKEAVVLWLVACALFAVYIANFSHYNKFYGSLAGVIIFLMDVDLQCRHPARRRVQRRA